MITKNRLQIINKFLSVLVILLAIVIIGSPLIPEISITLAKTNNSTQGYIYSGAAANRLVESGQISEEDLKEIPDENRLVIPGILVDGEIHESQSADALELGLWRRPKTSTPDKGGNTVIIAHRYLFGNDDRSFYNLPKVNIGDEIIMYWEGKEYIYKVFNKKEVKPSATYIEDNTEEDILTLYTCTPLWIADRRLVIQARPINQI